MSTFDSNELLGNALSIDHLHETIEKVKRVDLEDKEANLSSTREQRSDGNVTTNYSRARGSISSTLSSMKFSSMLGGFRADAEAKEKNLEAAEKAREARKILIAERAREKMEKEYALRDRISRATGVATLNFGREIGNHLDKTMPSKIQSYFYNANHLSVEGVDIVSGKIISQMKNSLE